MNDVVSGTNVVTRCKIKIGSVTVDGDTEGNQSSERVTAYAVYSDDPNSENRKWAMSTPMFNLTMTINNPGAFGQLKQGM